MDLRQDILGIVVGGSPAPGINSAISSVSIAAFKHDLSVIGFIEGFRQMRAGVTDVHKFAIDDVTGLHVKGGSFLRTSKQQLTTPLEVDNAIRVLQHCRVSCLVTIGGSQTAYSAHMLEKAAKAAGMHLQVVHVPKTIFNDIGVNTFGFQTAREVGSEIISNLMCDAKTMVRWYVVTCIGSKAGHLALGIGKAAAATITIIPEEYKGKSLKFHDLVDVLDGAMLKRCAMEKGQYGVMILGEGLVDCMDTEDVERLFGTVNKGHAQLSHMVAGELKRRWVKRLEERNRPVEEIPIIFAKEIGFELRAAAPNAHDRELSRDLGYGAVAFLNNGGSGTVVTVEEGNLKSVPFSDMTDGRSRNMKIHPVNLKSMTFSVACEYMIRLDDKDFEDQHTIFKLSQAAGVTSSEFIQRFQHVPKYKPYSYSM